VKALITLTTDFGLADGFVGVMRGVIYSIAPAARVIDISHGIEPQNIHQGAFVLANSVPFFPPDTIHVCVVDPGVGSARRAIAVRVGETILIGPDNGVLSPAIETLAAQNGASPSVVALDKPEFWLARVSNTFHGRDVFSPVAGHLAAGVRFSYLGSSLDGFARLALAVPQRGAKGEITGQVVHIDRYGNLVTNISDRDIADLPRDELVVEIAGRRVRGLARTYADGAPGELVALIGSPWKLEIAARDSSAARVLKVGVGEQVLVKAGN
jgi:S-adenosylmethionine hydrolase